MSTYDPKNPINVISSSRYVSAEKPIKLADLVEINLEPPPIGVWGAAPHGTITLPACPPDYLGDDEKTVILPTIRVPLSRVVESVDEERMTELEEQLEWINLSLDGSSRKEELVHVRDTLVRELARLRRGA